MTGAAIAEVGEFLEVTRADDDRGSVLGGREELAVEIGLGADVDALGRLVEQEHRRLL